MSDVCYKCKREYVECPECEYPFCSDCCNGKCPDCTRREGENTMMKKIDLLEQAGEEGDLDGYPVSRKLGDEELIQQFDEKGISMFDEMSDRRAYISVNRIVKDDDLHQRMKIEDPNNLLYKRLKEWKEENKWDAAWIDTATSLLKKKQTKPVKVSDDRIRDLIERMLANPTGEEPHHIATGDALLMQRREGWKIDLYRYERTVYPNLDDIKAILEKEEESE